MYVCECNVYLMTCESVCVCIYSYNNNGCEATMHKDLLKQSLYI